MAKQPDPDDNIRSRFLGTVVPAKATGNHLPDPARLRAPLEGEGSVIRSFCTGCGQYYELNDAGAHQLDDSLPASLEGQYFQVASCSQCDGTDPSVALKSIDGLVN